MEENLFPMSEADRLYGDDYRNEKSGALNPEHVLPSNTAGVSSGELLTPNAAETAGDPEAAKELAAQVVQKTPDEDRVLGYSVLDYVNTMYPNGPNVRHTAALKLYFDLLVLFDGNYERSRRVLLFVPWVQEIVTERGMAEIERIIEAGRKRFLKRESECLSDPLPSKEMRRAIEQVAGRKYSIMVREQRATALGQAIATQDDILRALERIGARLSKQFFKHYELLRLLCHRQKSKHYIAALYVGGCLGATLMTRMFYYLWAEPGKVCRLNSIVELIGRTGSGKSLATALYRIMMEPVKKADAAQIEALNRWNLERDQKSGGEKNKTPRPTGILRCLPSEASAAAIREAEFNAVEEFNGMKWPLHVFQHNSELDDVLAQQKKSYMNIEQLFYKALGNEPAGSFLKTSSSMVGEYDVHYNALFCGTPSAVTRQITPTSYAKGLPFRLGMVPMGESNYAMRENHDYDEADRQRDEQLREWSYRLDSTMGEIPIKMISDALHDWTARRMKDAEEEQSPALEDMCKRPIWVSLNLALPFIVSRHWSEMVEDGGRWKCGPDFAVDKIDVAFTLAVCDAQFAFQQYFALPVGEKHYDDLAAEQASNVRHQQKTILAYRRLPNPFSSSDVDREYAYHGSTGSICSRLKRLCDDGLAQKIRQGKDKGMYRKLA